MGAFKNLIDILKGLPIDNPATVWIGDPEPGHITDDIGFKSGGAGNQPGNNRGTLASVKEMETAIKAVSLAPGGGKSIVRSKRLTRAAEGNCCVNCGRNDGTVVACHYQGLRAHAYGKGKGVKPHDLCCADLCIECHQMFDQYEGSFYEDKLMRKIDLSERFLHCVMLTLVRRAEEGMLCVKGARQ